MLRQQQNSVPQKLNRQQRRAAKKNSKRGNMDAVTSLAADNKLSALLKKAVSFQRAGDFVAARDIYQQLISAHPNDLNLCLCLADFYDLLGDLERAYQQFKKAVTLQPKNVVCWMRFAACLQKRTDYEAAIISCKNGLALDPGNIPLLVGLANLLELTYDSCGAEKILEAAVALNPDSFEIHFSLGKNREFLGRFEEANESYRRARKLNPDNLVIVNTLIATRGIPAEDYDLELVNIDKVLAKEKLLNTQRASGLFAAASIHDKQKNFDQAFDYYCRANATVCQEHKFDRARHTEMVDELIEAFTPDVFASLTEAGNDSQLPVLVVGMPRSGTTLVEQILASHSEVFGASEMPHFEKIDVDLRNNSIQSEIKFPRDIKQLNCQALSQITDTHISSLRANFSRDAERIVDKLPTNYIRLGLFSLLFPNARIIHCRRDPMATCWSCYSKDFATKAQLSFAFDLGDLGFYYREYERLMTHWHKVMPGKILDVPYEQLITDPANISQAMISHIGLDWEEACLKFHEQKHSVQSASNWQVRQPIYKNANEKWRDYEDHLGPLRYAFEGNNN